MREPAVCVEQYLGYETPANPDELEFQILGLKNLIKRAEEKISRLEQTKFLVESAHKNGFKNLEGFFMETENEILHSQKSNEK